MSVFYDVTTSILVSQSETILISFLCEDSIIETKVFVALILGDRVKTRNVYDAINM